MLGVGDDDGVDTGGEGGSEYEELEELGAGDAEALSGTRTDSGVSMSRSLRRCPKWVMSFVPRWMSTPGMVARHLETSVAQWVNPERNLSESMTGLEARRC